MKEILNTKKPLIGYLGPKGTFTEQALKTVLNSSDCALTPLHSIREVVSAVNKREVDLGFLPLENSIEGSVNETVDMLIQSDSVRIVLEKVMPIRHNLITPKGLQIEDIEEVYSHPQAIAQCRNNLNKLLPKAKVIFTNSTSEAIKFLRIKEKKCAAIGSACGLGEDLEAKLFDIQDYPNNSTRFVLFSTMAERYAYLFEKNQKNCKTSIVFSLPDKPGALYEVLKVFSESKVNLKKIESRPTKNKLGEYLFFVDIEGRDEEDFIRKSLVGIEKLTYGFKNLGSYVCE